MQKTNQTQVHLEDSRVRINCSVASQTSSDSQHAVLWYVWRAAGDGPHELLLRIERSGAFEYGAYAEEERLRRRVQAERLSPRLYALTLNRAETGDSGTYYCLVEEWLSDPDGAWYRLARDASGFTQVSVRQPEVRLQVEEAESNITVAQAGSIRLGCSIPSQSSRDSRFSVSWYMERSFAYGAEEDEEEDEEEDGGGGELDVGEAAEAGGARGERQCVFSIGHDAVFGNGNCSPAEDDGGPDSRLQFSRASLEQYGLTIQRALPSDAGRYVCHVEEWLLNPRNAWYRLATNQSGFTVVNVIEQESNLQSVVCANDSLFYFVFFYPFPVFGVLLVALLFVRYRSRGHGKSQEGKNGAPLLWIKEPHLSYSPTCLDPPALSLHPGSVD
ncbi:immunoglobulin superfamily member 3-like [Gadus chalcogrammus]|uniref:immunoglobulin superfamily member 3-like n=1 Tax=Gadus chalcogrammus TaxID=1042646 RepID=UPI0024C488A1|nr:immunoglobulin superfamily member 3-like [Gadus chalcogrammus]